MSFIQICEFPDKPVTLETRLDKKSAQLLNTFLLGPSSTDCVVTLDDTTNSKQDNNEDNREDTTGASSARDNAQTNTSSTGDSAQNNNSFVRHNFSILEAYSSLHRFYEDDQQTNDTTSRTNNNEEEKSSNDSSVILNVKVSFHNEGYSIWTILLDSSVTNINKVKSCIKAGDFRLARTTAIEGRNSACFIVSQVKTFVSSDNAATSYAPFIGRCRYAMDSGSDKDSSEDNTVCIAIAPIDGCTKKPSENTVFKVLYNVLNVSGLTDKAVTSTESDIDNQSEDDSVFRSNSKDSGNPLSNWINKKFTNVGDSKKYNNFLKLREFIANGLNKKYLEYDSANSESLEKYKLLDSVKKALIAY